MSTRSVTCPNCEKPFDVPAAAAGKKIRCKNCQQVFAVPADDPPAVAKPAVAKPAKPAVAKPAASPPPPPVPDPNAPIPFAADDEDEDDDSPGAKPKVYGVTKDADEGVARCPFCAIELDPPDSQLCTNCGYDMTIRRRHRTVKTYALTTGDYFKWWWPALLWSFVLTCCGGDVLYNFIVMPQTEAEWRKEGILVSDKENPLTKEKDFIIPPVACNVCFLLIVIILSMWGVPAIWKRLQQPKPIEEEKRK
jgi:DNA-directed RNA polymerase subunit RPC12/RpoP